MKEHAITVERAKELLDYSPETGAFVWRKSKGKAKAGSSVGCVQAGYLKITIDREQIRSHRLAWFMTYGEWPKGQIDHINGDKLDNRIANLRDVPQSINMQNRYEQRKKTGLPRGVRFNGYTYTASIQLGIFKTAEEAGAAYAEAKRLLHAGCTR